MITPCNSCPDRSCDTDDYPIVSQQFGLNSLYIHFTILDLGCIPVGAVIGRIVKWRARKITALGADVLNNATVTVSFPDRGEDR
jgi:hypothetical protein